jgi:hypothetical protein
VRCRTRTPEERGFSNEGDCFAKYARNDTLGCILPPR